MEQKAHSELSVPIIVLYIYLSFIPTPKEYTKISTKTGNAALEVGDFAVVPMPVSTSNSSSHLSQLKFETWQKQRSQK